jgi:anti-anti-sigma regulatory factor
MKLEPIPFPIYSGDLSWVRFPGPHGPLLRCTGTLDAGTAERFRQEVLMLTSLGHRAVTLSLRRMCVADEAGLLTLLESLRALRRAGVRAVAVTRTPAVRDAVMPMALRGQAHLVRSEEEAAEVLDFVLGEVEPAEQTWVQAKESSARYWTNLVHMSEDAPASEIAWRLTAMHPLCDRSELELQDREDAEVSRCEHCPLFHALGGRESDLGCDSAIDPILGALGRGDMREAQRGIARVAAEIEALP